MNKHTAHIQERFLNCLRIAIVPEYYEEQRIKSVVDFCKAYGFDNVMLFINAEEYNMGHMTKEEAKPWVEALKRAKKALVEAGITVSLNPWMEIGHLDRGRTLKEGQDFRTQVDYNGKQSDLVVCPMDENWLEYFRDFYTFLIREIEPEVVWIEDDFRLHNHPPMEYGGCFCEGHMKAYNEKLGTNYSREEFVDLLFRKKPDDKVKKAYLEVNRQCMSELAEEIGVAIRDLGLGTKVGLMSSEHTKHSMEYRDWYRIHNGFAQGGPKINRLHLPLYVEDISMKCYYQQFNRLSFVCRGFIPVDCHVLPELETGAYMPYAKDPETLRFQLESAIPLEIEGMTYSIFGFEGDGAIEVSGYGPVVAEIHPYLTAVADSSYSYEALSGITIPIDEKSAYNHPIKDSFEDMCPDENYFGALLQGYGISARCSKDKEFKNQVIVLAAGATYNFSNEQLRALFHDNNVILDGMTAMRLIDRGLGDLIGAASYRNYLSEADIHSYEQVDGEELVCGIPGYRASASKRTGDYVALNYINEPNVQTRVFDYLSREVGLGIVVAKGHLVVPYVVDGFYSNQLNPMRQKVVCDYIDSLHKEFVRADYSNVYSYYSKAKENVLILVNATLHTLQVTRFKMTGKAAQKVYEIDRDGVRREKNFSIDNEGFILLEENFTALTTKTFILELV